MKNLILLFVLLLICCSSVYADENIPQHLLGVSKEDIKNEGWRVGTTKRFDIFEDFFSTHGMYAVYKTGYLYDISAEKIMAFQEAIEKFPSLKPVLSSRGVEINIAKTEFVALTNIKFPQSTDVKYLYFYFDNPFQSNNDSLFSYIQHSNVQEELQKSRDKRIKAANLLKQLKNIPWYLVKIPITGIKY